jgi:putative phosphoribosyl transferase
MKPQQFKKYRNRSEAGKVLSHLLQAYYKDLNTWVLALPRGGVPIAVEIARNLALPLDICLVRKLGLPYDPELAIGAVSINNVVFLNPEMLANFAIEKTVLEKIIDDELNVLANRNKIFRGMRPWPNLEQKTVILVDDGMATGATMQAAINVIKQYHPKSIILALPVAEKTACQKLNRLVDKVICPLLPNNFISVGQWYENFNQVSDHEVTALLKPFYHHFKC